MTGAIGLIEDTTTYRERPCAHAHETGELIHTLSTYSDSAAHRQMPNTRTAQITIYSHAKHISGYRSVLAKPERALNR